MSKNTIPEVVLYNFMQSLLKFVEKDIAANSDITKTFLHSVFDKAVIDKMDYLKEAIDLFSREKDNPRKIQLNSMYNRESIKFPSITLLLQSENQDQNDLNIGEHGHESFVDIDRDNGTVTSTRSRRMIGTYQFLCASESSNECIVIYRTLQALVTATLDLFDMMGLQNAKISGQDMRLNSDIVPTNIATKIFAIQFFHEVRVSNVHRSQIFKEITQSGNIVIE